MGTHHNKELGQIGEEMAVSLLRSKGLKILKTNWRYHHLEIDIVAQDGDMLVFVEVKTRTSSSFGQPEDAISKVKMGRLINAADAYIEEKDFDGEARFDVVAIIIPPHGRSEIEHFEDAFYA